MKTTNLTIIEAIQSGLPFKRESWGKLIIVKNSKFYWLHDGVEVSLASFDILATDWQIKLPEVTIKREKLAEAISEADKIYSCTSKDAQKLYVDFLCKKLGL